MNPLPMPTFAYTRHFLLLGALTILFAVMPGSGGLGPMSRFALYGALHASLLVVTLRQAASFRRRASFVGGAATLSFLDAALTAQAGHLLLSFLPFKEAAGVLLAASSGLGCLGYAYWVRRYWIPSLRLRAGVLMTLCCMIATGVAFPAAAWLRHGDVYLWLAVAWWCAFSGGLWRFGDRAPVR